MIQIVSNYTCEMAKQLFESAGLSVLFSEVEIDFDIASGKILLPVWVVINPYNQQPELLDVAFRRYMETTFKPVILSTYENKNDADGRYVTFTFTQSTLQQPWTYIGSIINQDPVTIAAGASTLPLVAGNDRYTINTDCGQLSTSLTARQYVDASECLSHIAANPSLLPLLAAMLYCPGVYSNMWAHDNAHRFASLPEATLEAVSLNFQAFVLFLFRKTHFNLLWTKSKDGKPQSLIATSIDEALLNLSTDGFGDHEKIDAMSLIKYLEILRNKKIQAVRTMHAADMKLHEIASKTGLDIKTKKNINTNGF